MGIRGRRALAGLALAGVLAAWAPGDPGAPSREEVVRAAAAVADTWLATVPPESMDWDWGEGVVAFGLLELARVGGDERHAAYVRRYLEHHRDRGVPPLYYWNDDLTPALSAALLVRRAEAPLEPLLDGAVEYVFEIAPRTPEGGLRHLGLFPFFVVADLWVDSLFHLVPLLVRLADLEDDDGFLEEAVDQTLLFARVMQDPDTGLFTHAWIDEQPGQENVPVPGFEQGAFWARGNGWALAALVDLLAVLPPGGAAREELAERARLLAGAVSSLQDPGGLWHTLLLDETSYLETAGSALLAYGLSRGARAGILGPESRLHAARAMGGLLGVLREDPAGTVVTGTSAGTLPVAELYATVAVEDQLPHGVGAWLLAASEFAGPHPPACGSAQPEVRSGVD